MDAVHAVLRKAFNDAMLSEQIIEANPALRAKRPRSERVERDEVWGPAELARFLDHARAHRLFAFFHLAAFTGARRGELLNLTWSDVDLKGRIDRHHRFGLGGRRQANRGNHQGRPSPNGEHRSADGA